MTIHDAILIALHARAEHGKARASLKAIEQDLAGLHPANRWVIDKSVSYLVGRGWIVLLEPGSRGEGNGPLYELVTTPPYTAEIEGLEWQLHAGGRVTCAGVDVTDYEQLRNVALGTGVGLWLRAVGRAQSLLEARQ